MEVSNRGGKCALVLCVQRTRRLCGTRYKARPRIVSMSMNEHVCAHVRVRENDRTTYASCVGIIQKLATITCQDFSKVRAKLPVRRDLCI